MRNIALLILFFLKSLLVFSQKDRISSVQIQKIEIIGQKAPKESIELLSRILIEFQKNKLKLDSNFAKTYHLLGKKYRDLYFISNNQDDLKNAIFYTNKSIKINSTPGKQFSRSSLVNSYFNLALMNHYEKDPANYESAIISYKTCIRIAFNYPEKNNIGIKACGHLATLYFAIGEFETALNYAKLGKRIGNKINSKDFAICLDKEAETLMVLKRYNEAENSCFEILHKFENEKNLTFYANAHSYLGNINYLKRDESKMEYYLLKAFEIFKKNGDEYGMAMVLNNIGYFYSKLQNRKKAINYFERALKITKDKSLKTRILDNYGSLFLENKEYQNALDFYKKAFQTYFNEVEFQNEFQNPLANKLKSIFDKDYIGDILINKSKTLKSISPQNSYLHASLETSILADQLVDFMRQEHTGTLSKYFWRNKTRSLYENAIETCYLLKDYEKAYYFMEKSRAVMLNDKLNELGAKQKLNETDQEREREYQRKIIELNTKIEAETKVAEKEKLNSQLFDLQEQQERFVKSLETKYPAYYQLKYNTQIGTLKQMQAYLKTNFKDKNATMVSYFFGDSASYAMIISPTRAEVRQFKYDIAQNQQFVNLLATNQGTKADYARILSMGSVIYQKLIKPLNIPKGHLIVSQDGVFMPFEALSTSGSSAQYLLKDYAISYTYSGQFLLKKQVETKFWPNQTFVGFAPVEFKNQLNTLKNSDITLGNVAKNYWFSDTFTGKLATKANFLQQAKDHKIVQIFTHAFADSVDTEPKIYFADDALKISELNAEDQFNTQLLVLSACKTGVGKLAKGEGVLSLARGFSMLGIPATITSLWSVEDKNTYQLTELFYKYLNQGLSKDEALQKAKLEFLELHPNSGPTDWAGMVLVGQTSQLTSNTPVFFVLGVIFSFAIIAGGLYFGRNRKAA